MIKKTIRIISMVCSCLISVSAILLLIGFFSSLANIGDFSGWPVTTIISYFIGMSLDAAFCAISGIIGGLGIKAFINTVYILKF